MAETSIDRGGDLGADTLSDNPTGATAKKSGRGFETLALIGGGAALAGAVGGLIIGYSTFHKSADTANAPTPAKASEHGVADVMGNPAAQQAALAGQLNQPQPGTSPQGATTGQTDVFGRPIRNTGPAGVAGQSMAGQPGQQGGTFQPGQHPVNQAAMMAAAARRSPIMAYAGNGFGASAPASPQSAAGAGVQGGQSLVADQSGGQGQSGMAAFGMAGRGQAGQAGGAAGARSGAGSTDFNDQLQHAAIQTVRASIVANRSFLLSAGTVIPCTMQTAINSTQSGYVSCVINHDVFSEDGRIVLLDKGTKVLGQYSGGIAQGQARMFVLWTRALTPRGVAIDLGSPAADSLGRAGMSGGVDTQFWARFGAALMMSVLEDASSIAGRAVANTGTYTSQVPSQMGQTILQSTLNIRPILRKNQGDTAAIFVAKDFDFRSVYDVRLRR